jgi:PAB1-binding protein PBP1
VSTGFRTDTDISSGRIVRERDLQKWDSAADPTGVDMSLNSRGTENWDQFEAHKKLTGLDSTYDEKYYTTTINTSAPDYKERQARADRIAREIENSSTGGNRHIAEERGIKASDDNGIDEEAK